MTTAQDAINSIPAPEYNQSGFDLFLVDDEAHMFPAHAAPQGGALFCAESVQIFWLSH